MGYVREIANLRTSNTFSAMTSAIEFIPSGGGAATFMSESHGYETPLSAEWYVDGLHVSLAPNASVRGKRVSLERKTRMRHPASTVDNAAKHSVYTAEVGQGCGLRCQQSIRWLTGGTVRRGYHGMLPVGIRQRQNTLNSQSAFNELRFGDGEATSIDRNGDEFVGKKRIHRITYAHGQHGTKGLVKFFDISTVGRWNKSEPFLGFVQLRPDGIDKAYFSRSTTENPETVNIGDVHTQDVGWHTWRSKEGRREMRLQSGRWVDSGGECGGAATFCSQRVGSSTTERGRAPRLAARIIDSQGAIVDLARVESVEYQLELLTDEFRRIWQPVMGYESRFVKPCEVLRDVFVRDQVWREADNIGYNAYFVFGKDNEPPFDVSGSKVRITTQITTFDDELLTFQAICDVR